MSKHPSHHPLNPGHYDAIQTALRQVHDANEIIRKAQAAGMDVRHYMTASDYYRQRLEAISNQFFPQGRPT